MKQEARLVESLNDLRQVLALEKRIVGSEDDADAALWEQAAEVVRLLDAGMSQRELARGWINARTGEAYTHTHVQIVVKVASLLASDPRPIFREAYNRIANAKTAHVTHNSGENEWYTPSPYIEAARRVMGSIDLDPASTEEANAVVKARKIYTMEDDGLTKRWSGNVWLNPPYAQPLISQFADKLAEEVRHERIASACVLVNNATETAWFQTIARGAARICLPSGRVKFWSPERDEAAPLQGQAILYLGFAHREFELHFRPFGLILAVKTW